MDIVIYTNPDTLIHKREKDMSCFWDMKRLPINFKEGEIIYFAIQGQVLGYFVCGDIDYVAIYWESNSWHTLRKKIKCKPFRGFQYKWW